MTTEELVLAEIKKHIDAFPSEDIVAINALADRMRQMTSTAHGRLALALVGAELAAS